MGGGGGSDPNEARMMQDEEAQAQQMKAEETARNTKTQRDLISALRGGASGYSTGGGKSNLGG